MTANQLEILTRIVDRYDADEQPVRPADIAAESKRDVESVRTCFENLEANYLLATRDEGGYRPTVTARELLELDVDDDTLLVLDACSEE